MVLTEKETTAIEDLKTQEQACINKYNKYKGAFLRLQRFCGKRL